MDTLDEVPKAISGHFSICWVLLGIFRYTGVSVGETYSPSYTPYTQKTQNIQYLLTRDITIRELLWRAVENDNTVEFLTVCTYYLILYLEKSPHVKYLPPLFQWLL